MKPIRDMESGDPAVTRAQQLLASVGPLPESESRMVHTRRALEKPRRRYTTKRPAVLAFVVAIGGCASAYATVHVFDTLRSLVSEADVAPPLPAVVDELVPAKQPRVRHEPAAPNSTAVEDPEQPEPPPDRAVESEDERRRGRPQTAPAREMPPHEAKSPGSRSDSELVHSAVKALRRDGDADRAARLLAEAEARSPNGPLAEEALSLRIEAALQRKDPKAAQYARQYLARYPSGRYRETAQRALRSESP